MIKVNGAVTNISGTAKEITVEVTHLLLSFKSMLTEEWDLSEEEAFKIIATCGEIAFMSNYGSTPFYDYYIDDILKILNSEETLFEMNEKLRQHICHLIGFEPNVRYTTDYVSPETEGIRDLRNTLHPKKEVAMAVPEFKAKPYYQVFGLKHPFMPNLSILDLLFNMGPESILVLRDSITKA